MAPASSAKPPKEPEIAQRRPPPQAQAGRDSNDSGGGVQQFAVPVRILEDPQEAERRKEVERYAQEREEQDLQAQRSMAESAGRMLLPAWWQAGIGFGGAILLAATLIYSARATNAAAAAADAANKTLTAERAWITWEILGVGEIVDSTVNGVHYRNGIGFFAGWKNTGRSPAINLSSVNIIKPISPEEDPTFVFSVCQDVTRTVDSSVGVGTSISGHMCMLTDIQAGAFRSGQLAVMFYSRVEYSDVFYPDTERVSEVCLLVTHGLGRMTRDGRDTVPFSVRSVGNQNRIT